MLLAIGIIGLMLAFNLRLREVVEPGHRDRAAGSARAAAASMRREPEAVGPGRTAPATNGNGSGTGKKGAAVAGAAGAQGRRRHDLVARPDRDLGRARPATTSNGSRAAVPSTLPTSATFARRHERRTAAPPPRRWSPIRRDPVRALDDITDAGDSPPTKERIEYTPAAARAARGRRQPDRAGRQRGRPRAERGDHHQEARELRDHRPDRRPQRRPGRDPVRGPARASTSASRRIEALADDLAMALAARIAPDRGADPRQERRRHRDPEPGLQRRRPPRGSSRRSTFSPTESKLTFALGRDVAGAAKAVDLAKMPHLLIAGATGSGKSVMVNAVITSLLCKATPDDVRMILMDLKRVELAAYNGLPHLLVPVITEPERAKAALKWAVNEMEGRYRRFAGAAARNIKAYNETRADPEDRMPYIVIIIDELADLMMREGKNVEDPIVRLAQKARATGIHMVLATQRPSVNVVTGLIKANFPSRIAFAMASQIDSRTILDAPGAEDLIGRGDMLYQPARPAPADAPPGRVRLAIPRSAGSRSTGPTRSRTPTTTWRSSRPTRRARARSTISPTRTRIVSCPMPSRSFGSTIVPRLRSSSGG